MFEVKILRSLDEMSSNTVAWDEFLANSSEHNIFHTRPMIRSLLSHGDEEILIVMINSGDKVLALAPFLVKQDKHILTFGIFKLLALSVKRLRLLGDSVAVRDGENASVLFGHVLAALNNLPDKIDYVIIDNLKVPGPLWDYFESSKFIANSFCLKRVSSNLQESRGIRLGDSYDDYLKNLTGKTRYNLRSRVKKLWKKGSEDVEVVRVESSTQLPEFLGRVDQVFSNSWRAKLIGYTKRNTDSAISEMKAISDHGWLRSYALILQGQAIAYAIGFQYRGVYLLEEIAYDKEWASHGVGNVLNFKLVEDLYSANKPDYLDFGFGENEYKRILGNTTEYSCMAYLVPGNNFYGHLIINLQRMSSFLYYSLDTLMKKIGISAWLKKIFKRGH